MRNASKWILMGIVTAVWTGTAAAQPAGSAAPAKPRTAAPEPGAGGDAPERPAIPMEGFWPTEKMVQRIFDRMAEGLAEHYDFDDEQMLRARDAMERFPKWMQENRGEIQGLMNEYFEALLDKEAPTPDTVAKWAQRVAPLLSSFDGLMTDVTGDMGTFMSDDQRVLLEGELAGFRMGMGMVKNKIGVWADGGYDPENEWIGSPEQRRIMRDQDRKRVESMKEARNARIEELGGSALDRSAPKNPDGTPRKPDPAARNASSKNPAGDEWVKYTEDFIKRYQLDDNQTEQARLKLKSAIEERDNYKLRIASDLERTDMRVAEAKTADEKKAAKTESERVRRPLERRFTDFKNQLDKIPTLKQKQAAALQEAKRDDKSKSEKTKVPDSAPKTAADGAPDGKSDGATTERPEKREELAGLEGAKKEGPSSP